MRRSHRRNHRRIWTALAILLPLAVAFATLGRQPRDPSDAVVRLDPPARAQIR